MGAAHTQLTTAAATAVAAASYCVHLPLAVTEQQTNSVSTAGLLQAHNPTMTPAAYAAASPSADIDLVWLSMEPPQTLLRHINSYTRVAAAAAVAGDVLTFLVCLPCLGQLHHHQQQQRQLQAPGHSSSSSRSSSSSNAFMLVLSASIMRVK
jgi:hypothetical protein